MSLSMGKKGEILKDTYLWQADVNELIQELLKRKSDSGSPYFSLDVQQYHQMKFLFHLNKTDSN